MQWDNSIVMWDEEIMTFWDEDLAVAVWDDAVIENDSRESESIMVWAFENERTQTLLHDVLAALPLADQAVVRGRLTLATDDRKRALDAGGDVAAKSSVSLGGVLWFDSAAMLEAPAAYQRAVLAHELAHLALGHHRQSSKALSVEAGEYAADAQAVAWGFASLVNFRALNERPSGGASKTFGEVQF